MRTSMRVRLGLGIALCGFLRRARRVGDDDSRRSETTARSKWRAEALGWRARERPARRVLQPGRPRRGRETRLTLQANINIQSTCVTRCMKANNDTTTGDGNVTAPTANDSLPPSKRARIIPKLAIRVAAFSQLRSSPSPTALLPRLGLGLAILGPQRRGGSRAASAATTVGVAGRSRSATCWSATTRSSSRRRSMASVGSRSTPAFASARASSGGIASLDIANYSWGTERRLAGREEQRHQRELNVSQAFHPRLHCRPARSGARPTTSISPVGTSSPSPTSAPKGA